MNKIISIMGCYFDNYYKGKGGKAFFISDIHSLKKEFIFCVIMNNNSFIELPNGLNLSNININSKENKITIQDITKYKYIKRLYNNIYKRGIDIN